MTRCKVDGCVSTICFVPRDSFLCGWIDGEGHAALTVLGLRAVPPSWASAVDGDGESWDGPRGRGVADGHETGEGALLGNAGGCILNGCATFGEETLDNGVVLRC